MQDLKSFLNEHKTHAGCLLDILGDPSQDPGLKKHAALLDFLEEDLPENAARVLLKYRKFPPKAREEKKRLILELGLLIQDCLEKNGITADFLRDLTAPGNRIANAVSGNEKRSGIRTTEGRVFLRAGTDVKFRNTAFGDLAGMPFFPKSAEFAREVSELSQIVVAENQAVFFDFESLTVLAEDSGTRHLDKLYCAPGNAGRKRNVFRKRILQHHHAHPAPALSGNPGNYGRGSRSGRLWLDDGTLRLSLPGSAARYRP